MAESDHEDLAALRGAELFQLGTEALEARNYPVAYRYLQAAVDKERSAEHLSQFALALVHHTGKIQTAVALCHEAIKMEPKNPEQFLRLATVYMIAGRRKETIRVLNLGLRAGRHPGISSLLQILGQRKDPVLPYLSRSNPLNKYLGKIRSSLGGRR